jgi:prepilin-type N-terminal cleavage/methylation domain-containing protein
MKQAIKRNKFVSKKGFTLIELLVVVLIIGILAAIALPQYRKAVFNSRMKELEMAMRSLDTAYAEYQLIHGKDTIPTSANSISVTLPSDCTVSSNASWGLKYLCKNFSAGYLNNSHAISNRQISASARFTPEVTMYMNNGHFLCSTPSINAYPIYAEYCQRMGYPS